MRLDIVGPNVFSWSEPIQMRYLNAAQRGVVSHPPSEPQIAACARNWGHGKHGADAGTLTSRGSAHTRAVRTY